MSPEPHSLARKQSLAAILSGAFVVGVTMGLSIPLVSLLMERLGHGNIAEMCERRRI